MDSEILGNVNDGSFVPVEAPSQPGLMPQIQPQDPNSQAPSDILGNVNDQDSNFEAIPSGDPRYAIPGQMIKTATEGFMNGLISEPLNTQMEILSGTKPEDIKGRQEENPITHGIGEGAGFLTGIVTNFGLPAILGKVGEGAKVVTGLDAATGVAAKVAAQGVSAGAEMAALQAAHEFTNAEIFKDPNFDIGQAAINTGLAGLIGLGTGAAIGGVGALWSSTKESALNGTLGLLTAKLRGEPIPVGDEFQKFLSVSADHGFEVPPEIRTALAESPQAQNLFKALRESGSTQGEALKSVIDATKEAANQTIIDTLGGENGPTKFEVGERAKVRMIDQAKNLADEANQKYTNIEDVRQVPVDQQAAKRFVNILNKKADTIGAVGGPARGIIDTYAERILQQPTIGHLDDLVTELNDAMDKEYAGQGYKSSQSYQALDEVKSAIRRFQDRQIGDAVAEIAKPNTSKSPVREMYNKTLEESGEAEFQKISDSVVKQREDARAGWHDYMTKLSDMASTAKLGRVKSAAYFEKVINDIPSEKLSDRLFDKKNYKGLLELREEYPQIYNDLAAQQKSGILEDASRQGILKHTSILNKVNGLSKEVRNLLFSKGELETLESASNVIRRLNERNNPSGSGMTILAGLKGLKMGGGAMLGALIGHGSVGGAIAGGVVQHLGGEAVNAGKLAIIKAIGSEAPLEAGPLKGTYDLINNIAKGARIFDKAVKATIRTGEILPKQILPDSTKRENLKDSLDKLNMNPSAVFDVGGNIKSYLPDHSAALGISVGAGVSYLQSMKPQIDVQDPFGEQPEPDRADVAKYNRALDVAIQPLVVLQHIKDGSLMPQDVEAISTIYPQLHAKMVQGLIQEMIEAKNDGETIPYQKKLGISMLAGQPLDATMTQAGMMAVMMSSHQGQPAQAPGSTKQAKPTAGAMKASEKVNSLYETPLQSREMNRKSG